MQSCPYPLWMRTIEVVRLANYRRIVEELKGDRDKITGPEIARALGISAVYAWQLENGKRDVIDSKAARKIERNAGKAEGWMDTDFEMWPFPDARLLERVESLKPSQRLELQGVLKDRLDRYEDEGTRGLGKSAGSAGGSQKSAQA